MLDQRALLQLASEQLEARASAGLVAPLAITSTSSWMPEEVTFLFKDI